VRHLHDWNVTFLQRVHPNDLLEVPQTWCHRFRTYFDVSGKGLFWINEGTGSVVVHSLLFWLEKDEFGYAYATKS